MKRSNWKVMVLLVGSIMLSGCTLFPTTASQTAAVADGGIWRSSDSSKTFVQSGDLLAVKGKVLNLNRLGVVKLAFDPSDANTVYAATEANGIFYSLDGGSSWSQFKIAQGYVRDVAVSPNNKCVVYALIGNKLYKTENCGRDFNNIYYHQKAEVVLMALAIDPKNPNVLYLGTSEGEVLKSTDGGHAWLTVMRQANNKIMDLIIDPLNSNTVYAGASRSGIFKTVDAGQSWSDLGAGLASYTGSHEYKKLIIDSATPNGLIFISKFGLLKTADGGSSWQVVELLPSAKKTSIVAVAVNPKNSSEFYYATASSLVKTADGGTKWSSQKLPFGSSRVATGIFVNPASPNLVFLTTQLLQK